MDGDCAGCGKALGVEILQAMGSKWHPACFVCGSCAKPFEDGRYVWDAKASMPFHKDCIAALGPKCDECGKPIEGPHVITSDGAHYHSTCFLCEACGCTLEGGYGFDGPSGKPYCAAHLPAQPNKLEKGDKYTIDVRNFEKVFIESSTGRKYRLDTCGNKKYEDQKKKPVYGGGTTWRQA